MAGIYLHIPFCKTRCNYCDFYKQTQLIDPSLYFNALEREMEFRRDFFAPGEPLRTVYFGGGTPSLLGPERVARVMKAVNGAFSLTRDCEVTLEANPGTVFAGQIEKYRECGINRLSIGMQTSDERMLALLGRCHSHSDTVRLVGEAKDAGLDNISMPSMSTRVFCPIPQTGKHIFSTGRDLIVFDEDESTLTNVPTSDIPGLIMAYSTSNNAWASSGTLWINVEGNRLSRLTAAGGYTTQPVDFGGAGYDIRFTEVACLPDHDGLMAPALRHSDGQNVIIRISDAGTVTELEQTATSGEISSLIRLD